MSKYLFLALLTYSVYLAYHLSYNSKIHSFMQAIYQVGVLLVLNFLGHTILGLSHESRAHAIDVKDTVIFNAFVLCQVSITQGFDSIQSY